MVKTKSHIYLILSIILAAILVWLDISGVVPELSVDVSKYQVDTNDMIFNFFNVISNIYTFVIVVVLLFIRPSTRNFAKLALLQLILALIIYFTFDIINSYEYINIEYFTKINTSIYFSYSMILIFILNFTNLVNTIFMKTLLIIASVLYIFMLTTGQFYFMNITIFSLLINISFVFVTTSLAYSLIYFRKYYFL